MGKDPEIIYVAATIEHETEKAYLLDVGTAKPSWFPKSMVEDNKDGTFAMPFWLAKKNGAL